VHLTEAEREAEREAELLARRPWLQHIRSREAIPAPLPELQPEPQKPKKKPATGKRKPVKCQVSEGSERYARVLFGLLCGLKVLKVNLKVIFVVRYPYIQQTLQIYEIIYIC
jgi:hypothetical protein